MDSNLNIFTSIDTSLTNLQYLLTEPRKKNLREILSQQFAELNVLKNQWNEIKVNHNISWIDPKDYDEKLELCDDLYTILSSELPKPRKLKTPCEVIKKTFDRALNLPDLW